jgi:hypothetical protein
MSSEAIESPTTLPATLSEWRTWHDRHRDLEPRDVWNPLFDWFGEQGYTLWGSAICHAERFYRQHPSPTVPPYTPNGFALGSPYGDITEPQSWWNFRHAVRSPRPSSLTLKVTTEDRSRRRNGSRWPCRGHPSRRHGRKRADGAPSDATTGQFADWLASIEPHPPIPGGARQGQHDLPRSAPRWRTHGPPLVLRLWRGH